MYNKLYYPVRDTETILNYEHWKRFALSWAVNDGVNRNPPKPTYSIEKAEDITG